MNPRHLTAVPGALHICPACGRELATGVDARSGEPRRCNRCIVRRVRLRSLEGRPWTAADVAALAIPCYVCNRAGGDHSACARWLEEHPRPMPRALEVFYIGLALGLGLAFVFGVALLVTATGKVVLPVW